MTNRHAFSTEGLVLWLDAADAATVVTGDDGTVSIWRDRSGENHHAVSRDGVARPALVHGAINGKPVVRFDGNAVLDVPVIRTRPGPVSVFVVTQRLPEQASDGKWQRLISSWEGGEAPDNRKPNFCVCASHPKGTGTPYPPVVWDVFRQQCGIGPISIGRNRQNGSQRLRADIAEVLVFDRQFIAEDPIQAVCRYLAEKWDAKIARADEGWTRIGQLVDVPKRKNDRFPLSDQDNAGNWQRYDVMWDEFEGGALDPEKWWPRNPSWSPVTKGA